MVITVVSCFYIIKNKHSLSAYDKWISNFMLLNMNKYIYCDNESYIYLTKKYNESSHLKYVIKEISDFYNSKWNWKKDELLDNEIKIGHNELLYKIWNEKIFLVMDAINNNFYGSDIFAWVDIGCFRHAAHIKYFTDFPNSEKIVKNKINISQINKFNNDDYINVNIIDNRFKKKNIICAGMFAGSIDVMLKFALLYEKMIDEFDKCQIFKGKEQSLMNFMVLQNPELFNVIFTQKINNYDKWFYLHYYWSNIKLL